MYVGTLDELIAILEVERDRVGGQAAVRYLAHFALTPSIPFVKRGYLRKDGAESSRKTPVPCVFLQSGDHIHG